jgi:hypothetical protein
MVSALRIFACGKERFERDSQGWALANVATQAVVPSSAVGAASGVTLTSLVMLGAVSVAIAASVLELLAGSAQAAASDEHALNVILRSGAALALAGAAGLVLFGRQRAVPPMAGTAG